MVARCTIPVFLALWGCNDNETAEIKDTGFTVATVIPVDGDEEVVESINPELRVNHFADPSTCNEKTIDLVRVVEGEESVTWEWTGEILFPDNGLKIKLQPEGVLPNGYWYMLTVRSGSWGCTDTHGEVIKPFASRFYVP